MKQAYLISEAEHAELLAALFNAKNALNLALGADDLGDGPGAVCVLVRDLLDEWTERFDSIHLDSINLDDVDDDQEGGGNG